MYIYKYKVTNYTIKKEIHVLKKVYISTTEGSWHWFQRLGPYEFVSLVNTKLVFGRTVLFYLFNVCLLG